MNFLRARTALYLACACGHPEVVTLPAERRCQMKSCDNRNRRAVTKAVQYPEEECAPILLEHGADPYMKGIYDSTALHYAAQGQHIAIAEKLLLRGVDMEAPSENARTPLLVAVSENRQEMAEFVVNKNANIHAVGKWKRAALMLAVKDKYSNTARLLLQRGVDVFAQDGREWTAEEHGFFRGLKANNWRKLVPLRGTSDYVLRDRLRTSLATNSC